ncbi:hypothetical protein [Burkholderia ubonensis]|uniref:hypothetical protein n=1 Tax=Burkholderia ubonensis TaxID=101571 RepID=UPI0012F7A3D2|nr:hypothetical protein [Burkholderia ubonensis]
MTSPAKFPLQSFKWNVIIVGSRGFPKCVRQSLEVFIAEAVGTTRMNDSSVIWKFISRILNNIESRPSDDICRT